MDDQRAYPRFERIPRLTIIKQITRIDTLNRSAGAALDTLQYRSQIGLSFRPIKTRRPRARIRELERDSLLADDSALLTMFHRHGQLVLRGKLDPELVIKHKMKIESATGFFECSVAHKDRGLTDDLKAKQIFEG